VDVIIVVVVATAIYGLQGFDAALSRDLGVFVYGGEHVAQGVPPYVGIFNTVGPLADAVPGLAIWLGGLVGLGPILSARAFFLALSVACCALVYLLARDTFSSRSAGFVSAAAFLTFQDFLQLAAGGPREKTTMVLFLVTALVLVNRRRWLTAGVFTALATLVWQPAFAMAATAVVVAVLLGRAQRLMALTRWVAGGLIPSALTVLILGVTGALAQGWAGFVTVDLLYTRQPSAWSEPAATLAFLWKGYHYSLVVFGVGLVCVLALGGIGLLSRGMPDRSPQRPTASAEVVLAASALAGVAWTLVAINGPPDLFELLPITAVGIGGAVSHVARHLPAAVSHASVAAVCIAAVGLAGVEASSAGTHRLLQQQADISEVLAAAPPGTTVTSINAPEVLAITDTSNPTSYQLFDGPIDRYLRHTSLGGVGGYASYLSQARPGLLIVGSPVGTRWPASLLDGSYRRAGSYSSWTWYVSRALGPQAWAAVSAANRAAPRQSQM
jgi:hypothetical protein